MIDRENISEQEQKILSAYRSSSLCVQEVIKKLLDIQKSEVKIINFENYIFKNSKK